MNLRGFLKSRHNIIILSPMKKSFLVNELYKMTLTGKQKMENDCDIDEKIRNKIIMFVNTFCFGHAIIKLVNPNTLYSFCYTP